MAAIDKIYGTKEQRNAFYLWCADNYPEALPFFYLWRWNDGGVHPITNFTTAIDMWLLDNCPLDFVLARIREQYEEDDIMTSIETKAAF